MEIIIIATLALIVMTAFDANLWPDHGRSTSGRQLRNGRQAARKTSKRHSTARWWWE